MFITNLLTPDQVSALTPDQKKQFLARLAQSAEHASADFQKDLAAVVQKHLKSRAAHIFAEIKRP